MRAANQLHDAMWMGCIEDGLPESSEECSEEIERLPYLLRLLKTSEDDELALVRIQDRAALYSVSEEIYVISCYLSPCVLKKHIKNIPISEDSDPRAQSSVDDDLESRIRRLWHDLNHVLDAAEKSKRFALSIPDSSLAQSATKNLVGGSSDLAASLACIMHYTNVSHFKVAVALCRASFPQTPMILFRLAANCPSACPVLIRGCVDVLRYCETIEAAVFNIIKTCSASLAQIARLSRRQLNCVLRKLREDGVCIKLQMELLVLKGDVLSLSNFVISNRLHLSLCAPSVANLLPTSSLLKSQEHLAVMAYANLIYSTDVEGQDLSRWWDHLVQQAPTVKDTLNTRGGKWISSLLLALLATSVLLFDDDSLHVVSQHLRFFSDAHDTTKRLLVALIHDDVGVVSKICIESLDIRKLHDTFVPRLKMGCTRISQYLTKPNQDLEEAPSLHVDLQRLKLLDVNSQARFARSKLHVYLQDDDRAALWVANPVVLLFIVEAAAALHKNTAEATLPVIFPLEMGRHSLQMRFSMSSDPVSSNEASYLLRIVYCLWFLENLPSSPFRSDIYSLPLNELFTICRRANSGVCPEIRYHMIRCLGRLAPETYYTCQLPRIQVSCSFFVHDEETTAKTVFEGISSSLHGLRVDVDGRKAERSFISALQTLPYADLLSTTVSALISKKSTPPQFITYSNLCRDPLLPLQCPLSVWRCSGLRRIVMLLLNILLRINESLILREANDEISGQLLLARDALVVQTLLRTESRLCEHTNPCCMVVATIRMLVASRQGIVIFLEKHCLEEKPIDMVIEYIPECFTCGMEMVSILSEPPVFLTVVERLAIADNMLRMAVINGHGDPHQSQSMVYTALSQLLASFALIVGPSNVPVSAFVSEQQGVLDTAAQKSRALLFRMLNAISSIRRSRAAIRGEATVALQRLTALCKAEPSSRQKALLKEIIDVTVKTANAIGVSLQL